MEFSELGRQKRFAALELRGLEAVKADLESADRRAIGGPAAVSLAWEWVVMKETAGSAKVAEALNINSPIRQDARDRPRGVWLAAVDWKSAWRRFWGG